MLAALSWVCYLLPSVTHSTTDGHCNSCNAGCLTISEAGRKGFIQTDSHQPGYDVYVYRRIPPTVTGLMLQKFLKHQLYLPKGGMFENFPKKCTRHVLTCLFVFNLCRFTDAHKISSAMFIFALYGDVYTMELLYQPLQNQVSFHSPTSHIS